MIKSDYFKSEDNENEISRDALMLMGLLHSKGDTKTKTRVFYDIL